MAFLPRFRGGPAAREFILHAGHHKTGTTTIQWFISRNRRRLAPAGVYVPRTGTWASGGHHELVAALADAGGSGALAARLRREIGAAPQPRILISSEVAKERIAAGEGAALLDGLRAAGADRIRLLLYLRSPFAHANALYAEFTGTLRARGRTMTEHLQELLATGWFDFAPFLELASRAEVELEVRPYDARARRDIIPDFLAAVGIEPAPSGGERRLNVSLGPIALEAMRRVAAELGELTEAEREPLSQRLQAVARKLREPPFWGVDETAEQLLRPADAAADHLARSAWGKSWREVVGEEAYGLNRFDEAAASEQERETLAQLLGELRDAAAGADAAAPRRWRLLGRRAPGSI